MNFDPEELWDRQSDVVKEALKTKCGHCKAAVGRVCVDIISGQTLHLALGRYVHVYRVEP